MPRAEFGTALNCIDGRVQLPVIAWMREVLSLDYVDLITEPGIDGLLALDAQHARRVVQPKLQLSIARHASPVVAIAAHHDCLANPVAEAVHRQMLRQAVDELLAWDLGVKVMALWVNERWMVDVVLTRGARR